MKLFISHVSNETTFLYIRQWPPASTARPRDSPRGGQEIEDTAGDGPRTCWYGISTCQELLRSRSQSTPRRGSRFLTACYNWLMFGPEMFNSNPNNWLQQFKYVEFLARHADACRTTIRLRRLIHSSRKVSVHRVRTPPRRHYVVRLCSRARGRLAFGALFASAGYSSIARRVTTDTRGCSRERAGRGHLKPPGM